MENYGKRSKSLKSKEGHWSSKINKKGYSTHKLTLIKIMSKFKWEFAFRCLIKYRFKPSICKPNSDIVNTNHIKSAPLVSINAHSIQITSLKAVCNGWSKILSFHTYYISSKSGSQNRYKAAHIQRVSHTTKEWMTFHTLSV